MRDVNARERLLEFLDRKVFDPILRTPPDRYPDDHRKRTLARVQRNTESEKRRFHEDYVSAREIHDNFLNDLDSHTAQRVDRDLDKLGLPKLPDVRDEFLRLYKQLGMEN